jgi:hypothetical protein
MFLHCCALFVIDGRMSSEKHSGKSLFIEKIRLPVSFLQMNIAIRVHQNDVLISSDKPNEYVKIIH